MLVIAVGLRWWRICIPFAVALLVAWVISKLTAENTAWLSYALLIAGLVVGGGWQIKSARSARSEVGHTSKGVSSDVPL